ncbi:MAG: CPBP family intramembrane glutamic endopeptidase [Caldilineaceae bacterium]
MRAGWRVLLHLWLWALIQIFAGFVIGSPLTDILLRFVPVLEPIADGLLFYLLNLSLVVGVTWVMATQIDHRFMRSLGLQFTATWWYDLAFGLFLGALLMTLVFVAEWQLGWIFITDILHTDLADTPFVLAIWQPILLFIVVGINEELLSRGYQLRNLAEGFFTPRWGPTVAVLLAWLFSSTLFGMLHIFNPNSTWVSTAVLMLAGCCFGLGYVLTGQLGLSIGFHIAWNFFQGTVYGFPVSGNMLSTTTVFHIQQQGPPLWTGGKFGPEAGLVGILALILGGLCTFLWVQWHYGQIRLQTTLANYYPRN